MIHEKYIYYIIKLICEHHTIIGKGSNLLKSIHGICNEVCTPIVEYSVDNQPKILRLKMMWDFSIPRQKQFWQFKNTLDQLQVKTIEHQMLC
jgi:hypothetical protein